MPGVPYLNPYVQYAGFQFDYNSAFLACCTEYAVGTSTIASAISSFNTASVSSLTVSSINGMTPGIGSALSTFNTASISSLTISSINGMTPGIGSALSTFNTLQTSSLTVSSLNGWSPDTQVSTLYNLSTVVGGNTDPLTLSGSLWSYARYAEDVSDTNLGSIQTLSSIVANLSTFNVASISSLSVSSINGLNPPWATYNLTGSTISTSITNRGTGSSNAFPQAQFTLATTLTFNIPPNWASTNSLFYDGWALYNFQLATSLNAYWGVSYATNTNPTPIDILGSTTVVADALTFTNTNQVYLPVNIILPPTHLTSGGNVTLNFYGYVTTQNHYFSVPPVVNGRVGISLD